MNNVFDTTNVDLYHLLGLEPTETNFSIIKKNFSNLIKTFHSDRGGDSKLHQQIVEAYRILSNPSRKFIYDNFGILGVYCIKDDDEILKVYEIIAESAYSEANLQTISKYLNEKVLRKLKRKYSSESEYNCEITSTMSSGVLDYIYFKQNEIFYEKDDPRQTNTNPSIKFHKLNFDNHLKIYSDNNNNREITTDLSYDVDLLSNNCEHEYSVDLYNRVFFPVGYEIFDQNFIDTKFTLSRNVSHSNSDVVLNHTLTIFNLFRYPLNMNISPSYSLNNNHLQRFDVSFNSSPGPSLNLNTKLDLINRNLNLSVNYKHKQNKLMATASFSERFSIGGFYYQKISSKFSKAYSAYIRHKGLTFTNESIVSCRKFSIFFTSNLILSVNKNKLKCNSNLIIGLRINSFKIQFPIIMSSNWNYISQAFILTSSILGYVGLYIRKKIFSSHYSYYSILNKINMDKQNQFNNKNYINFENKINLEKINSGFFIVSAYFGELNKIYEIHNNMKIFGVYFNHDSTVFDIKVPLMLHIVDSRLEIPENILEIEGIYIPDYSKRHNLGLTIMYSYNNDLYFTLIKNNKNAESLP